MGFLIGTDEAGYGPNFGPLVVTATVWHVADQDMDVDLYDPLAPLVVREPTEDDTKLAIADSKQLYRPGGDLSGLERGVLATLALTGGLPRNGDELWNFLCPQIQADRIRLPWYQQFNPALPVDTDHAGLATLAAALQRQLEASPVGLVAIRSAVLFPAPFNHLVAQYDSKGTVLSMTTLNLISESLKQIPAEPVRIVCDKHGGRNHYAALLQPLFGDGLIRVVKEGRQASIYDISTPARRVEIQFRAGGESFLPSALASMTSKYLREVAMKAFNSFWSGHVKDLKPTAGYPTDARRFKTQIAQAQSRLGIGDTDLWRNR